ncbi:MAG: glycine dehydrogenase (aminomethyl-transferring) [Gammaproteobacteria bacterium GWF2_41_13]|nr:MAG: glycine dehydrogenase (aminomethyl-transferring) [Gammaproteobacteria bacterium GWF2_41_13]
MSELIFEQSQPNRSAPTQMPVDFLSDRAIDLPESSLRTTKPLLPEVSELQVVRHYTNLSKQLFSVDTHFYPLGSCTMKYNPHIMHQLASLPGFLNRHPLSSEEHGQGFLACLFELQEILKAVTGMAGVSLTPMAGAQGEFAGISMIRQYHQSRHDDGRTEIIVPDAAHGTNPASASMCGYTIKEIPTLESGDLDLDALKKAVGPQTAGIMLTNPSTLGVFERRIKEVAEIVHNAGGLLYYDGANLNAILGKVRPGDMNFDVMHINLHKTFGTPHGGGGPGAGPVAVNKRLLPFLPVPYVEKVDEDYRWVTDKTATQSIGQLSAFMGNAGILLRAYVYTRLLGAEGMTRVAEFACLNSNYMKKRFEQLGFKIDLPERRASHEFIISMKDQADAYHVTAMDYAKRLLDYGYHAPTVYFPLIVPECMLIEPTETETKETLDEFIDTMAKIKQEAMTNPELVQKAPHTTSLKRLDAVKAARELNLVYTPVV